MIPKTIHYCWFGGVETSSMRLRRVLESEPARLPNCPLEPGQFRCDPERKRTSNVPTKLFSFVADYARTKVLERSGRYYPDSDTYVFRGRSFDHLLGEDAFIGFQYPWPQVRWSRQPREQSDRHRDHRRLPGHRFLRTRRVCSVIQRSTAFDVYHAHFGAA